MSERKEHVVIRLDRQVYEDFEKKFGKPMPDTNTTQIQAGFLLGVQYVLRMMREGLVKN